MVIDDGKDDGIEGMEEFRLCEDFLEDQGHVVGWVAEGATTECGKDQCGMSVGEGDTKDRTYLSFGGFHHRFGQHCFSVLVGGLRIVDGGNRHKACFPDLIEKGIAFVLRSPEYGDSWGINPSVIPIHRILVVRLFQSVCCCVRCVLVQGKAVVGTAEQVFFLGTGST